MRRIALQYGVPEQQIILDGAGLNTRGTADNVASMLHATGKTQRSPRVIIVSDFYHLPRCRLAFSQAGVDVITVPAKERGLPRKILIIIPREIIGWWGYLLTRGT